MNNIVLHEINRINEIMFQDESVKPEFINESVASPSVVIKSIKRFIDKYDSKSIKSLTKEGEMLPDVKKLVDLTGNELTRELNILLSKLDLTKLSKTLVNDGWGSKTREDLLKKLVSKLNEKKTISEKIEAYRKFVKLQSEISSKTFSKFKIDGLSSFNKLVDELENVTEGLFNEKLKKEIGSSLYKKLTYIPLKWDEKIIRSIDRAFENNLTSIRRYIARSFTSQSKLDDEILTLLEQSMSAKNLGLKEDFYIKKIQDVLASKKKTSEYELSNLFYDLKNTINKENPDLGKYLEDIAQSDNILKKLDDIENETKISWGGAVLDVLRKYKNMVWPFKDNKMSKKKVGEMFQRQLMFILNANPSTPKEIYSQLIRQGFRRTVAIRIVNSYIATLIIYPIFVGVKNYFFALGKAGWNTLSGNPQEERKVFSQYIKDAYSTTAGRYFKWSPFSTFIPEFFNFLDKIVSMVEYGAINIGLLKITGGTKEDVKKAEEAIKNIGQEKPQTGDYTNDPSGFKEYIKKRFKDNNPVISGTKDVFTYEDVEFNYNNGKFE
jgi:hypothetical protein